MSELPALDPEQIALLGFIHRHCHGGLPATATTGSFRQAYEGQGARGLMAFDYNVHIWHVTEAGGQWLRKILDV